MLSYATNIYFFLLNYTILLYAPYIYQKRWRDFDSSWQPCLFADLCQILLVCLVRFAILSCFALEPRKLFKIITKIHVLRLLLQELFAQNMVFSDEAHF